MILVHITCTNFDTHTHTRPRRNENKKKCMLNKIYNKYLKAPRSWGKKICMRWRGYMLEWRDKWPFYLRLNAWKLLAACLICMFNLTACVCTLSALSKLVRVRSRALSLNPRNYFSHIFVFRPPFTHISISMIEKFMFTPHCHILFDRFSYALPDKTKYLHVSCGTSGERRTAISESISWMRSASFSLLNQQRSHKLCRAGKKFGISFRWLRTICVQHLLECVYRSSINCASEAAATSL